MSPAIVGLVGAVGAILGLIVIFCMCCLVFREKAGKPVCAVEFIRARGAGQLCPGLGVRCKPTERALTLLCLFTLPQVLPSEVRESRRENPASYRRKIVVCPAYMYPDAHAREWH